MDIKHCKNLSLSMKSRSADFTHLKTYSKILVTGPHRSGTTISAKMIASDLGYPPVIEEKSWFGNDIEPLRWWLEGYSKPCVCQAPFAAHAAHSFNDDVLVIFMIRDVSDIQQSEQKMMHEGGEPVNWAGIQLTETRLYNTGQIGKPISMIKYENWEHQKPKIKHWLELSFEDLRSHPMWIEDRKGFHVRQTNVG